MYKIHFFGQTFRFNRKTGAWTGSDKDGIAILQIDYRLFLTLSGHVPDDMASFVSWLEKRYGTFVRVLKKSMSTYKRTRIY